MSGFITMQREAFNHPVIGTPERFYAWFWLVAHAAWKPTRTRVKGATIILERGELSFSQRFLAESWGWSKSRVDRFIADLRAESMIATRSKIGATAGHIAGQGQAIITICNYDKYQTVEKVVRGNDEQQIGATAGQQRGKEEQGNKGKKEEEPPIIPRKRNKPKWASIDRPMNVSFQVWDDFEQHRRSKEAPITPTVIKGFEREAGKLGWTLEQAITESIESSWRGFKATWVKDRKNGNGSNCKDTRDGLARALDRIIDPSDVARPAQHVEPRTINDGRGGNVIAIAPATGH